MLRLASPGCSDPYTAALQAEGFSKSAILSTLRNGLACVRSRSGVLAFLSQRPQLRSHLLQRVFQLGAARAFLVQRGLHVAVLQRHGLDGRRRGHLAWTRALGLGRGLALGLGSHGGQQILSTSPKQTLRHRELTLVNANRNPNPNFPTFFFLEPP